MQHSARNLHEREADKLTAELGRQQLKFTNCLASGLTAVASCLTTVCTRRLRWFTAPYIVELVQAWRRAWFGGAELHWLFSSDATRYTACQGARQRLS